MPKKKIEVLPKASSSAGQPRFHMDFKNYAQKLAWGAFQQHDILFLIGPAGTGKAQPLDALVYTPDGPRTMGNIHIKDKVCCPDGKVATVIGEYPQGEKDIFRIVFNNGDTVECCEDHLWVVGSASARGWINKTVDTRYIRENVKSPKGRRNLTVQVPSSVYFKKQAIPIPPYLLGVLLGDGCFVGSTPAISSADEDILNECRKLLLPDYLISHRSKVTYGLTDGKKGTPNVYKDALRQLGLWGCRSWEKIIPDIYLYNSKEVRLELLRGLMDTDGTVNKRTGSVSYLTTSSKMAEQFKLLIESLGGLCKINEKIKKFMYKGKIKEGRLAYDCSIRINASANIFRLSRKAAFAKSRIKPVHRFIESVDYVGKKQAKCIMLDAHDGLYLTNNFVVTHNTHLSMVFAIHEILQRTKKQIVLTRPIVEAGESLGYLPGTAEEKVHPYMLPLFDAMKKLVGTQGIQHDQIASSIEVAPLAYLRGRSFGNSICIFDEAQNATFNQLKLFLTRIDDNSKIIITGDPGQSDLGEDSGLLEVMHRVEGIDGIGIVRFDKTSIVRHPLVASILEKLES